MWSRIAESILLLGVVFKANPVTQFVYFRHPAAPSMILQYKEWNILGLCSFYVNPLTCLC